VYFGFIVNFTFEIINKPAKEQYLGNRIVLMRKKKEQ
jgi:hypothetical protein